MSCSCNKGSSQPRLVRLRIIEMKLAPAAPQSQLQDISLRASKALIPPSPTSPVNTADVVNGVLKVLLIRSSLCEGEGIQPSLDGSSQNSTPQECKKRFAKFEERGCCRTGRVWLVWVGSGEPCAWGTSAPEMCLGSLDSCVFQPRQGTWVCQDAF